MNKNSNTYTFIYASVMVIFVAAALAFVNMSLKAKQNKNVEIDKMSQILRSIKVEAAKSSEVEALYTEKIQKVYLLNVQGEIVNDNAQEAFSVDMSKEVRKSLDQRQLPVYEASVDGAKKYIIPVYGAGLWGPIWGYVSLNEDMNTVYSASFSHQAETPGLGAEIATDKFQSQFSGKQLYKEGQFRSLAVLKSGAKSDGRDAVDAISGGTITSKGLEAMLMDCLSAYDLFFTQEQSKVSTSEGEVVPNETNKEEE